MENWKNDSLKFQLIRLEQKNLGYCLASFQWLVEEGRNEMRMKMLTWLLV